MCHFNSLFSPFRFGNLELKNRIVLPPMATNFAGEDGTVNHRHIAYYVRRAKGGAGYLTFEHTGIRKDGRAFPQMALIDSDDKIPSFKRLVEEIHRVNSYIVIQLNHAGRNTYSTITGAPLIAPSAIPCPVRKEMPREMSHEDIKDIINAFQDAARRVYETGADGVEIHMAHGYLLNQFLSPFSNKRIDKYGGNLQGRMRLAIEVLRAVRRQVGPNFLVVCRISAEEFVDGGLNLTETKEIAKSLELNGADGIHVTASIPASVQFNHPPYYVQEGIFLPLAQEIKSTVSIPVIAVGRIRTPELANKVIEEGKADLISMGRALIADPELPTKAFNNQIDDITPCISCNRCALSIRKGALQCAVNPEAGRESLFEVRRAENPKKIWVIGGGPAGMKAAQIAAQRGHNVTLFEEKDKLGGKFLLAAIPPKKEVLKEFIDYLERQIKKQPVKILLKKRVTPTVVEEGNPDILIIATGSKPFFPRFEGIQESFPVSAEEALQSPTLLGKRVVIVGGGGIGAEVADFLSENGKEVTIVEMRDAIALDLVAHLQYFLNKRLKEKGVQILTQTKAIRFERDGLWVEDCKGIKKLEGFDSFVIAMGSIPNNELVDQLKGKNLEIYVIGDASKPREVMESVLEGEEVALKI